MAAGLASGTLQFANRFSGADGGEGVCQYAGGGLMSGGAIAEGREQYKFFFAHMLGAIPIFGPDHPYPKHELASCGGEPIILGFRFWDQRWRLNEVHRLEEEDGKVSRIRCYCWSPDTLRFIGSELGHPVLADAEGLAEAMQELMGRSEPSTTGGYRSP